MSSFHGYNIIIIMINFSSKKTTVKFQVGEVEGAYIIGRIGSGRTVFGKHVAPAKLYAYTRIYMVKLSKHKKVL